MLSYPCPWFKRKCTWNVKRKDDDLFITFFFVFFFLERVFNFAFKLLSERIAGCSEKSPPNRFELEFVDPTEVRCHERVTDDSLIRVRNRVLAFYGSKLSPSRSNNSVALITKNYPRFVPFICRFCILFSGKC